MKADFDVGAIADALQPNYEVRLEPRHTADARSWLPHLRYRARRFGKQG